MARPSARNDEVRDADGAFRMLAERLRVSARKPNILQYTPHEKQVLFHTSEKKRKLYIGGNRSGKTTGGVCEDVWWASCTHPYRPEINAIGPKRGRVIAVDFVQGVEKILFPQFKQWITPSMLINGSWEDSYDKQLRTLYFANGSEIEFLTYEQDLEKHAGTSRHFVHMDEEPPESIYNENVARLIDTNGTLWMTMTPVEGMTWVYDTLYEPGLAGSNTIDVIEVDMTENPFLDPQAVQEFLDSLTEEERTIRGAGKFVTVGGRIYKRFDDTPGGPHVLKTEGDWLPPSSWLIAASLDHGYNNPTALLFHAVSPDGQIVTFKEHYQAQWTIKQHAEWFLGYVKDRLSGRMPDILIADPSIKNTDPITGTSIWQEYERAGIVWMLGNNDVVAGLSRVRAYMEPDKNGKARWMCTDDCTNLIKEHKRYRYKTRASKKLESDNNAYEQPHKKNDHTCDSLRYFIMSRPDLTGEAAFRQAQADSEASSIVERLRTRPDAVDVRQAVPYSGLVTAGDVNGWSYETGAGGYDIDEYLGTEY